jgi:hypothetical protein
MAGATDIDAIKARDRPKGLPFRLGKIGHVVLNVTDLARSTRFYTEVLGLQVSDVYAETMVPGGMVFMRLNPDHHGIALVGGAKAPSESRELNHVAFEVATLDEVIRARDYLRASRSISRAAAAPAARSPSSSATPMATGWRSTGASTRSAATVARARPRSGRARRAWRRRLPIR